jgi:hypothetical protein
MWFKKNKWKIIIPAAVLAVLAAAFWYGGNSPDSHGWTVETTEEVTAAATATPTPEATAEITAEVTESPTEMPIEAEKPEVTPTLEPETAAEPTISPTTAPTPTATPTPKTATCTISISCATLVGNSALDPDKAELVPPNGVILGETTVELNDGDSVFDVLKRVCREKGIQLEFTTSPVYATAYIEGIGNIYEFDAGELSGWVYSVNGEFPNYGSSNYTLTDGDVIKWCFTCDMGNDVK